MPLQPLGLNALLYPLGQRPLRPLGLGVLIQPQRPLGKAVQPLGQSLQPLQPPSPLSPFVQTALLENLTVDDGFVPPSTIMDPPKSRALATWVEDSQMMGTLRSPSSSSIAPVPSQTSEIQSSTVQETTAQRQPLGSLKPLAHPSDFQLSPLEPERPSTMMSVSATSDRVVQPKIVQQTVVPPQAVKLSGDSFTTVPSASVPQPLEAIEHESPEALSDDVSNAITPASTIQPKAGTQPLQPEASPPDSSLSSDSWQVPAPISAEATAEAAPLETLSFSPSVESQTIQTSSTDTTPTSENITRTESDPEAVDSDLSTEVTISTAERPQTRLEAVAESVTPAIPDVDSDINDGTAIVSTSSPTSNVDLEATTSTALAPTTQLAPLQNQPVPKTETPSSTPSPFAFSESQRNASEDAKEEPDNILPIPEAPIQRLPDSLMEDAVPLDADVNLQAAETPVATARDTATPLSTSVEASESSTLVSSKAMPATETLTHGDLTPVQPRLEAQPNTARAVDAESIAAESVSLEPTISEQATTPTVTPAVTPDSTDDASWRSTIAPLTRLQTFLPPLTSPTLSPPQPLVESSNFLTSENKPLTNIQPSRTTPELPTASARLLSNQSDQMEQTQLAAQESMESSSLLPELQTAPEEWSSLSELIGETAKPVSSDVSHQPLGASEGLDRPTINQAVADETHQDLKPNNPSHQSDLAPPEQFPFIQRSERRSKVNQETPDAWSDLSELIHKKPKASSDEDFSDRDLAADHSSGDAFEPATLASSSGDHTSDANISDSITLTSPIIQTAPQPQPTAHNSQIGPVDEHKLEQLAHIVYRLMQTQFMVNQERRGSSCINPPMWSRNLILNNGGSATATGQQAARASPKDISLSNASLQTLAIEVHTQLQQRFEIDRERYGIHYANRLSSR